MPRVLCTRPGASTSIGGIDFTPAEGGMLSAPLTLAQAQELFLECPGFALVPDPDPPVSAPPDTERRGPGRPRKEDTL